MIRKQKLKLAVLWILLFSIPLLTKTLHAEIYKYIGEDGTLHFTDDISKIPSQYRDDTKVYLEQHDAPSQEKETLMPDQDPSQTDAMPTTGTAREKPLNNYEMIENSQPEQIEKENHLNSLQTKVTIQGNQVLVPVKLGYRGKEVEALLLLDTGASLLTLHKEIAYQLSITQAKRATAQVVGGKVIRLGVTKLNYVKVGPVKVENIHAGIINHKGPPVGYSGLLGMNVLQKLDYRIDFENQTIIWQPKTVF